MYPAFLPLRYVYCLEGIIFYLFFNISFLRTSLVAQRLKRLPAMQETWVRSLGRKDPLEKEMATHSSTLAWRIPWMEEPGVLQSTGLQRVGHDWATSLSFTFTWKAPLFGLFPCRPGRSFVCLHLESTFSWNVGYEIVILKERIHLSMSVWRGQSRK